MYDPIGLFIKLESWPVYTAGNYPEWIGIDVLGRTEFQLQDGYSLISVKKKKKNCWVVHRPKKFAKNIQVHDDEERLEFPSFEPEHAH